MCYLVFISTNTEEDLADLSTGRFSFERACGPDSSSARKILKHKNLWNLLSRNSGCSCGFRHLSVESGPLEFEPPQDWAEVDPDDVISTQEVYDFFSELVDQGYSVDVVDIWNEENIEDVQSCEIHLDAISREAFHFFEGWRFELCR
jgi:hypothetical protein